MARSITANDVRDFYAGVKQTKHISKSVCEALDYAKQHMFSNMDMSAVPNPNCKYICYTPRLGHDLNIYYLDPKVDFNIAYNSTGQLLIHMNVLQVFDTIEARWISTTPARMEFPLITLWDYNSCKRIWSVKDESGLVHDDYMQDYVDETIVAA